MKQSIHHPNVDCVPDHLENEIVLIQCVKRWPYIYIYKFCQCPQLAGRKLSECKVFFTVL